MGKSRITNATDEELAEGARAGSLSCFEELVRRYQVPLMRFVQRQWPRRQDAEDVIQEAFLRAWQSIRTYRAGAPLKPWLFVITSRVAIDTGRRRRRDGVFARDVSDQNTDSPLDRADRNESSHHFWQVVRRALTDEPFAAVWLHYVESMSSRDIASITGRSRVWVKTTLFRARGKIRIAFEQSCQLRAEKKIERVSQA